MVETLIISVLCISVLVAVGAVLTVIKEAQRKTDEKNLQIQRVKLRAEEKEQRQMARQEALADKEEKLLHVEKRMQETEKLNRNLVKTIFDLQNILQQTLSTDLGVSFEKLKIDGEFPKFVLPADLEQEPIFIGREKYFSKISKPSVFGKLIPGWEKRYQKTLQESEKLFKEYEDKFNAHIIERNGKIARLREEYANRPLAKVKN
jgi:restriction system protein